MTALLLMTGLTAAHAQGIRVHYKNGNTVDIPAALFDHMSPGYVKNTDPDIPDIPDNPDTGDLSNPGLWAGVLLLSGLALGGVIVTGRKARRAER